MEAIYQRLTGIPVEYSTGDPGSLGFLPAGDDRLGGPAQVFIPLAAESMRSPWEIPCPSARGANAIGGCSEARQNTSCHHLSTWIRSPRRAHNIPEIGCLGRIDGGLLFDQARARREALRQAAGHAKKLGLPDHEDVYIVEEESFNVVRGFHTVGRIYNIRSQLRPRVRRIEVTKDIADRKA